MTGDFNFYQAYTDGKLKVLVYHNSNPKVKLLSKSELEEYDVIMISCTVPNSQRKRGIV